MKLCTCRRWRASRSIRRAHFAHVTLLATLPSVLVVHPSLPAKNVQELIGNGGIIPVGGVLTNALARALSSLGIQPRVRIRAARRGARGIDVPIRSPLRFRIVFQR